MPTTTTAALVIPNGDDSSSSRKAPGAPDPEEATDATELGETMVDVVGKGRRLAPKASSALQQQTVLTIKEDSGASE